MKRLEELLSGFRNATPEQMGQYGGRIIATVADLMAEDRQFIDYEYLRCVHRGLEIIHIDSSIRVDGPGLSACYTHAWGSVCQLFSTGIIIGG